MHLGLQFFCNVIALILFGVAALGLGGRFNLVAAGLFFYVAGQTFG